MGYMRHHALVVTGCDYSNGIEVVHAKVLSIVRSLENKDNLMPKSDGCVVWVSPISPPMMNGYRSFFVTPDGSKEGWATSTIGDRVRSHIIDFIDSSSRGIDYVEVQFGDDGGVSKVTRHSDEEVHSDEFDTAEVVIEGEGSLVQDLKGLLSKGSR